MNTRRSHGNLIVPRIMLTECQDKMPVNCTLSNSILFRRGKAMAEDTPDSGDVKTALLMATIAEQERTIRYQRTIIKRLLEGNKREAAALERLHDLKRKLAESKAKAQ